MFMTDSMWIDKMSDEIQRIMARSDSYRETEKDMMELIDRCTYPGVNLSLIDSTNPRVKVFQN